MQTQPVALVRQRKDHNMLTICLFVIAVVLLPIAFVTYVVRN
jgi:hypothetical protein